MTEKHIKPHIVVSTDLALGDDYGAVMALCAYAAINKNPLSFIGTFGDRSAKEASDNLALVVPRLWNQLGQPEETLPGIYMGADRPIGSTVSFEIPDDDISRIIHGEFERTQEDKPAKIESSEKLVKTLIKSNIPVALLSIGAPTEAANLTESLGSLIHISVAMLGEMGTQGNVNGNREANASRDPKANIKLLEESGKAKIPFTLVPLETTEKPGFLIDRKMTEELEKELGKNSYAFQELMTIIGPDSPYGGFYLKSTKDKNREPYTEDVDYGGVVLHDLTATMTLIDLLKNGRPRLLKNRKYKRVGANTLGNIFKAREYMDHFIVDIAGSRTKHFWPETISLLKHYK